jgi:NSS family neurotransmitter:Na+ symporter
MPQLFARMMFGSPLAVLFFLGLTFAGFSSLIAQLELPTRVLVDTGLKRSKAIWVMVAVVYLLGIPSARNLNLLSNQDFVWSIGLMISGAFVAFAVISEGVKKLIREINVSETDWSVGAYWSLTIRLFIPLAAFILLFWWLFLSATVLAPGDWYNPMNPFSVMTCLVQFFIVTAIFVGFNRRIARKTIA